MNINSYIFSNEDGTGPGVVNCSRRGASCLIGMSAGMVNLCVRAPAGKKFIDDAYHTCVCSVLWWVVVPEFSDRYVIEWHTGQGTAQSGIRWSMRGRPCSWPLCADCGHFAICWFRDRADYYWDGDYIGSIDAFVPTRARYAPQWMWLASQLGERGVRSLTRASYQPLGGGDFPFRVR